MKITADEVLGYYYRTENKHVKEYHTKWLKEEFANSHIKVTDVLEETQKQGITEKQLRMLREELGIESNKTDFKGFWEISSPDSKNIQEPEEYQDASFIIYPS